MPSAGERRAQPHPDDLQGQLRRNRTLAQRQHVHIVVLARPACSVEVPAKRAAYASNLVGHDGFAIARAAEHNPSIKFSVPHGFSHRADEHRIIHRLAAERAKISNLVPQFIQESFDVFLVVKSGVV